VRALSQISTGIVSSSLTKTVLVTNYFHRVRAEAAMALVNCATDQLKFIGLFHLFKIFLRYCHQPPPDQDLFSHKYVPQPNDFSDFSEYFVRKAVVTAISRVRFANGKTPGLVRRFLIDQLRYNDNTNNSVSSIVWMRCDSVLTLGAVLGCSIHQLHNPCFGRSVNVYCASGTRPALFDARCT